MAGAKNIPAVKRARSSASIAQKASCQRTKSSTTEDSVEVVHNSASESEAQATDLEDEIADEDHEAKLGEPECSS